MKNTASVLITIIGKANKMNKDNINWEQLGRALLWNQIVHNKNEDSHYDIMLCDGPEGRGIHKGDIGNWKICSYIDPFSHKSLTWKELAIELGLGEEFGLFWDGHDCDVCPENSKCNSFFKGDKDHERCRWWMKNMNNEQ